jgi:hypothetical protein
MEMEPARDAVGAAKTVNVSSPMSSSIFPLGLAWSLELGHFAASLLFMASPQIRFVGLIPLNIQMRSFAKAFSESLTTFDRSQIARLLAPRQTEVPRWLGQLAGQGFSPGPIAMILNGQWVLSEPLVSQVFSL